MRQFSLSAALTVNPKNGEKKKSIVKNEAIFMKTRLDLKPLPPISGFLYYDIIT
jgi:hypothetical protein